MKLSEIQQNVTTNMLGMDVDPGDMNRWINDAQYDLAGVAKLKGSVTIPLVSGTASYALPADYRRMVLVTQSNGYTLANVPVSSGLDGYSEWNGNIILNPVPQDSTLSITLYYYAWPIDLVGSDDVSVIPKQFHRGLVFYCTAQAKRKYMQMGDGQDFDNSYQMVKADLAQFADGGPKQIRSADAEFGNPAIPYGSPLDDRWW